MSKKFTEISAKFANQYLIPEKKYENLLSKIAFFKAHPDINEKLLDYAVTMTIISSKKEIAHEIPNPIEIDDVFFKKTERPEEDTKSGNDYSLYM